MTFPDGSVERFDVDPFRKECLLAGIDEIDLTLRYEAQITAYEETRAYFPFRYAGKGV